MPVDSPLFLLAFLPLALLAHWLCPRSGRTGLLLALSLLFYALSDIASLPLFLGMACFTMLAGLGIERAGGPARSVLLVLGVAGNLAFLVWAKYFLFFLAQIPGLEKLASLAPASLPLGVSFFTFSAVSYLADVAAGRVQAGRGPARFGLFLAFFPKIAAGPIARWSDMRGEPAAPNAQDLREGLTRVALGLGKKVLLAGGLGPMADQAFALRPDQLDAGTAWLGLVSYSLQLYFDFSGYTDMAVGLGLIFGYRLPENFNYPYISQSVREFWRRWHMTLSTWFRDYLYIPLGGGRGEAWRVQRNLLIVFVLCGLWHGASWSFVVWGLWHGVFLALERSPVGKALDALPRPLRHLYALLAVGLGWVFFRATDFTQAVGYLRALVDFGADGFAYTWRVRVNREYLAVLGVALVAATPVLPWLGQRLGRAGDLAGRALAPALLALALMQLAAGTYSPFIYAQF